MAARELTETGIALEYHSREDWERMGHRVIVRGEERFSPVHEDPEERQRFMEFFGGLELEEQVEVVKAMQREELLEGLHGDATQRSAQLKGELAVWLERNNDQVERRSGSLARMDGSLKRLTWDEHPEFINGYLDQLVKERAWPESDRHEGFGEYEAGLADLHEQSKRLAPGSVEEIRRKVGGFKEWRYLTVTQPPVGGDRPDWVREAWVDTSIPVPPSMDAESGERWAQEPELHPGEMYRTWTVNYNDAVLALMADGKWEAARYWMKHYPEGHRLGGGLAFAEFGSEIHENPGPRRRRPVSLAS